jgi:hypothetical protein
MYVYNCNSNQIKFSVVEFARCPDKMALERGENYPDGRAKSRPFGLAIAYGNKVDNYFY